jgi:hypothetical protein
MTGNLPLYNIYDALIWYAECMNPSREPESRWAVLHKRLEEKGWTGMQFLHFYIYSFSGGSLGKLHHKNYLCCDEVWLEFLKHMDIATDQAKMRTKLQKRQIRDHVEYGYPLKRLLTEKIIDINSLVRIEVALRAKHKDEEFDSQTIIDMFGAQAAELLVGVPSYLPYCPYLNTAIKEGTFNVAEYL